MKKWIAILLAALLLLGAVACTAKPDEEEADYSFADGDQYEYIGGELNVMSWGEYIDPELIPLFEKETGVHVNYIEIPSNEEMIIKLRGSEQTFDICIPSDYCIEQMIRDDMLLELDQSKIPNVKNISENAMAISDDFDPGHKYSVPYMWGTVGILYNKTLVDDPVDSWGILWNEKYAGQIWMYDSVRDTIGITLKYLGYDLNTHSEEAVAAARDKLIEQAPLRKGFGTDNMRSSMINGKAALAVMYSGDAFACMDENEDLDYAVPTEGSNVWFDNAVILKNSKNVEAAHAFINFLNDANIAARNTEFIFYSTPSQGALERLDAYFTENETYNPPQDVLDRCEVFHDLGSFTDVFNAAWSDIKAAE